MIYGYCRISTKRQSLQRQIDNMKKYEIENNIKIDIFTEVYTGIETDRKVYQSLKKKLKTGDTLIFDSVSRMSRNTEEGVQEYFELYQKGIKLIFLKERYIDTEVYDKAKNQQIQKTGNRITDILLSAIEEVLRVIAVEQIEKAFQQSEKEVQDLRVRTSEALRIKKAEGVVLGRKEGSKIETKKAREMKEKIKKLSKSFGGSLKDVEAIEILKINRNTYFKYKKELKVNE